MAAKLQAEARKTGRPFKETVNACLRAGLSLKKLAKTAAVFRVQSYDMGPRRGVNLDKISTLLDDIEGADHR